MLESDTAHIGLVAPADVDFTVDRAGGLAEKIVLERDVTCVAGQVLTGPHALLLGPMLRRLCSGGLLIKRHKIYFTETLFMFDEIAQKRYSSQVSGHLGND